MLGQCLYNLPGSPDPVPTTGCFLFKIRVLSGVLCSSVQASSHLLFPACRDQLFLRLEEAILGEKPHQLSWMPLFPRTVSHKILQSKSLMRKKSTLLKSRLVILLFALLPLRIANSYHLMAVATKVASNFNNPD